ncbi:MAG: hypothetical protein EKK37_12630 [Sphingobacteriales bacterium]|nr:MAG: hypothetical protein EKK37_12630 [Sphingobacteriales bacterium]
MDKKILKATHQGELPIPNFPISCAVLDDGTRILVDRSVATALGVKGGGAYWAKKRDDKKGALLPEYISAKYLQKFISPEVRLKLSNPITYINKSGKESEGIPAETLLDICDIWIDAAENGALGENQLKIAKNAQLLIRGFAAVGIIALVDEATGYQDERTKDALAKILEEFLLKENKPYIGAFPTEFYKQIYRLNNWPWNPNSTKRPGVIGKWTNDIIYERLAPGVLEELKKRNPTIKPGLRKYKHFQFLTDEVGDPALKTHFDGVTALQRAAPNWSTFIRLLERAYPKFGDNLKIDFPDDEI